LQKCNSMVLDGIQGENIANWTLHGKEHSQHLIYPSFLQVTIKSSTSRHFGNCKNKENTNHSVLSLVLN
jgi:hypothetical protein